MCRHISTKIRWDGSARAKLSTQKPQTGTSVPMGLRRPNDRAEKGRAIPPGKQLTAAPGHRLGTHGGDIVGSND